MSFSAYYLSCYLLRILWLVSLKLSDVISSFFAHQDSLGGNSRTAMVATVSPAADNYDETLSTLRYADRAKSIVNHAVINEDPNARIIRELREEVEKLRSQLTEAEVLHTNTCLLCVSWPVTSSNSVFSVCVKSMKAPELKERLEESEKLIQEMTVSWEEKLRKTEEVAQVKHILIHPVNIKHFNSF